jgi:cytochrome c-type biogenesis protein CcmH/NrfG
MRRCQAELVILFALIAITFAVFRPVTGFDFLAWDDNVEISNNSNLTGLNAETLHWAFTERYVVRYQPLTWLVWAAIVQWQGKAPAGFHWANLVVHLLNVCLVFLLIRKLFLTRVSKAQDSPDRTLVLTSAGLGALLWAVHPLRIESGAWVSGFLHGQALLFLLLSALLYLETIRATSSYSICYWGSVICFAASLLSFPTGLGFAVVPLALDIYFFGTDSAPFSERLRRCRWWIQIPFLVVALAIVAITLYRRFHVSEQWVAPASVETFGTLPRLMQAFYIWAYFLWKQWLPFDLSPVYTTLLSFDPLGPGFIFSAVVVLFISVLLFWRRTKWPGLFWLWCCYLVLMVPMLGLTEHPHYPSDRYGNIPGVCWSILIASLLYQLGMQPRLRARRGGKAFVALLAITAVTVLVFAIMTFRQIPMWRNDETFFRGIIVRLGNDPYRADTHWRLGMVYAEQFKFDQAVFQYQESLRLAPENVAVRNSLAGVLLKQGKVTEALPHLRELLRVNPDRLEMCNNLAWILATHPDEHVRNGIEALALAERACRLSSNKIPAYLDTLAAAYAETGRYEEAVRTVEQAMSPAQASGQSKLAETLRSRRDLYQAGRPFREP